MVFRKVASTSGFHRGHEARALAIAITLLITLQTLASPGAAAPLTALGGYDHYEGPFGQRTDGVLGALVVGAAGGDLTLAGVRYDDTTIGPGYSVTGGVGVPLATVAMVRLTGTRFINDDSFRAWRAKVGPQFNLPGSRSVTLSYAHYQDNLATRSNGVIAEASTPLLAHLSGKATTSYATTPQGPSALQGSIGLGWSPIRRLELSGEVGIARNAAGAAGQPFPAKGPLDGLPLIGGGSSPEGAPESSKEVEGTVLIGLRVVVP